MNKEIERLFWYVSWCDERRAGEGLGDVLDLSPFLSPRRRRGRWGLRGSARTEGSQARA